jgi:hypothetical protein
MTIRQIYNLNAESCTQDSVKGMDKTAEIRTVDAQSQKNEKCCFLTITLARLFLHKTKQKAKQFFQYKFIIQLV